ncbi:hypothetical protein GAR06_04614 [Micromonospora saelicesensis]|uniref:hypothetical protein n=1 Tax=Micromonospora saelicesensis TaxID=285676 RepID=UPI000DC029A9|nr:hypothetical protein [Micromonospora saelicesensis]RAO43481.1 hypothetical protein GAR06_04614 [Micromonospora saelicesensis]RAO61817.1 hypothetical protein LUPAC06_00748 [Micromonospora saelicesensis]
MLSRAATTRRALAGLGLTLLLVVGAAPPAAAALRADPGAGCPPDQPDCSVWDDEPGNPGDPGGGGDNGGGGDDGGGGGGGVCQWNGRTIPCYDEDLGWFNNGDGCYYKLTEGSVEPPEGHQWYLQTCNGGDLGAQDVVSRAEPPAGFGAPPDPEELARRALASISLLPARLKVAPRKNIGPGLVGLPVWMWATPGKNYFGPIYADESDRGLTVYIEAKVDRIVWDMGNGEKVTCYGAGTEYKATGTRAGATSPDCGYDEGYPKADTYDVTATTHWTVSWWTNSDATRRVIPQTRRSGIVQIRINELQVVTR